MVERRASALLNTIYESSPLGLAFLDVDLRFVRVNESLAAMTGRHVEEHLGRTVSEVFGPDGDDLGSHLDAVARTQEAEEEVALIGPVPGSHGAPRRLQGSFTPVREADGELAGVSLVLQDVTERRALEARERAALQRVSFLARAGALLDATLLRDASLRTLAAVVVPELADWCTVHALQPDGTLRMEAIAHPDPERVELGWATDRRAPLDPGAAAGVAHVMRTGRAEAVNGVSRAELDRLAPDPEQRALLDALGLSAYVCAPLLARGRVLGAFVLGSADAQRPFTREAVLLAEELGRRAGMALDNARLYSEHAQIAHALQVKLLPERLPDVPGVELAARYRAAGELNEVGGDFYDVFGLPDGRWVLFVGDVSGKGAEAAAITAMIRYTLRASAAGRRQPSAMLEVLNDAMREESGGTGQFCTVCLATMTVSEDGTRAELDLALGGHPPPVVRRADGRVEPVGALGTVIGAFPALAVEDSEVVLEAGDVLVMYTDGVTEAGPRSAPLGEDGLQALLARTPMERLDGVLDEIERAAVALQEGQPRDDIALLALRTRPLGRP